MKPTNPRDTIKQLGKAATRQNQQFVASLLVTVAVLMKRNGLTKLDLSPEDLSLIKPGEQLLPIPSLVGGLAFEFQQDLSGNDNLLGKQPTPQKMIDSKKARQK